jgi:hypothetical protein
VGRSSKASPTPRYLCSDDVYQWRRFVWIQLLLETGADYETSQHGPFNRSYSYASRFWTASHSSIQLLTNIQPL